MGNLPVGMTAENLVDYYCISREEPEISALTLGTNIFGGNWVNIVDW
jgi:hypothetical protein